MFKIFVNIETQSTRYCDPNFEQIVMKWFEETEGALNHEDLQDPHYIVVQMQLKWLYCHMYVPKKNLKPFL